MIQNGPQVVPRLNPTGAELTNRFGIYVHVPFCVHKCSYCDFYSFTKYEPADFEKWLSAVTKEIEDSALWLKSQGRALRPATSIFFGGGTPSLLPPEILGKAFDALKATFAWSPEVEITVEANPETLDEEKLAAWKALTPINRVSLGAQSFQPRYLEKLERLASPASVRRAAHLLQDAGYVNFNLDLIIGIPGQTEQELVEDIREASQLGPKHLSNYNLTLKPAHPLYPYLPGDDFSATLYETAREAIEKEGYQQYEISNYAKPGQACAHNLLYWTGADFLGLGPSAASRFFWDGVFSHRKQVSDFGLYQQQKSFGQVPFERTTLEQSQLEATFLELRLNDGLDMDQFASRYRKDLRQSGKWGLLLKESLLQEKGNRVQLTPKGRLLADAVANSL